MGVCWLAFLRVIQLLWSLCAWGCALTLTRGLMPRGNVGGAALGTAAGAAPGGGVVLICGSMQRVAVDGGGSVSLGARAFGRGAVGGGAAGREPASSGGGSGCFSFGAAKRQQLRQVPSMDLQP
jgi:hypothetical protein